MTDKKKPVLDYTNPATYSQEPTEPTPEDPPEPPPTHARFAPYVPAVLALCIMVLPFYLYGLLLLPHPLTWLGLIGLVLLFLSLPRLFGDK